MSDNKLLYVYAQIAELTNTEALHNMPTPYALSSLDALFTMLEEDIRVCDSFRDGSIEMTIRKLGTLELELSVSSFRGSYRCLSADLCSYLEECLPDTQGQILVYRDRFRVGLKNILPMGFGALSLDFTKCRKGRTPPIFGYKVTEVLEEV